MNGDDELILPFPIPEGVSGGGIVIIVMLIEPTCIICPNFYLLVTRDLLVLKLGNSFFQHFTV